MKILKSNFFALAIIITLGCIVYLPFIGRMGFYADDWQIVTDQISGRSQVQLFSIDRPFLGYSFAFFKSILGVTPLHWHLAILLFRLIGAVLVFLLIKKSVNASNTLGVVGALVFLFFPGFLRQPSSVCYLTHIITFTCAILSLYLTVLALDRNKVLVAVSITTASLAFELLYLVYVEYFIGLELVRLILIFVYLRRNSGNKKYWMQTLVRAAPYIAVALLFLVWRVLIFKGSRPTTDTVTIFSMYLDDTRNALVLFARNFYTSMVNILFNAWVVPLYNYIISSATREILLLGGFAVLCTGGTLAWFLFSAKAEKPDREKTKNSDGWYLVILGLLTVVLTFLPIIATRRYYIFGAYFDRYSIPPFLGVAFLVAGIMELLKGLRRVSYIFLGVLLFVSFLTQMHNSSYYANVWKDQKHFWQQVTWRIPQLEPGAVMVPVLPPGSSAYDEIEVFTTLNTIYYPDQVLVLKGQILNDLTARWILKGDEMKRQIRTFEYNVDYNTIVLAVMTDGDACVHVIDPDRPYFPTGVDPLVRLVAPRASLAPIQPNVSGRELPVSIYGAPLAKDWCYFYEQAELVRRDENWQAIADLEQQATAQDFEPHDPGEWFPFLEAYAHLGRGEDYTRLIFKILVAEQTRFYLCYDLSRSKYYEADPLNTEIVNDLCSVEHELNLP